MTLALMTARQEVNNFESSVVVQELEFAMNLASAPNAYYLVFYTNLLSMELAIFTQCTLENRVDPNNLTIRIC